MTRLLIMVQIVVLITACSKSQQDQSNSSNIQDVVPAVFEQMLGQEDVILIDVRTPEEVTKGMIHGATVINYRGDQFKNEVAKLDKTKKYLLYCRSGGRSAKSCDYM